MIFMSPMWTVLISNRSLPYVRLNVGYLLDRRLVCYPRSRV
jgi:hypothetical protein